MSLKRNFAWLLGSKTIAMAVAFITGALINRALGTADRGVFAELQTWVGLFAVIVGMSLDSAIYHFANRERYGDDDRSRFVTTAVLTLACAVAAAVVLAAFVVLWPDQVSAQTRDLLILADLLLIATMVAANLTVLVQAQGDIRFSSVMGVVQAGVSLLVIGGGYALGLIDVFYAVACFAVVQLVAIVMIAGRYFKAEAFKGHFSRPMASGMIRAGLMQHVATVSTFLYMKVNQLIVFRYCGESEAGLFAVSLNLAFAFMFIPLALQQVLYPRVIHSKDDYEVTVRSMRVGLYGWGVVVLIVVFLAEPLLLLYGGQEFLASVTSFRVIMLAAWFMPLSALMAPYYVKKGAFGIASLSAVVLGAISIGLNLAWVPSFASTGAAWATGITCVTGFCMVLAMLAWLSRRNPLVIFIPDFRSEFRAFRERSHE